MTFRARILYQRSSIPVPAGQRRIHAKPCHSMITARLPLIGRPQHNRWRKA